MKINDNVVYPTEMDKQERLHALDSVRAFALIMGVVLYSTVSFLPETKALGSPLADSEQSEVLGITYYVIHIFRMTLFFLLAGFFARASFHAYGLRGFAGDRAKRILLPLVIGWPLCMVLLAAIFAWVMLKSGTQIAGARTGEARPAFSFAHLWFLYYLVWLYLAFLILRGVAVRLDTGEGKRRWLDRVLRLSIEKNLAPLLLALPLALALDATAQWRVWAGIPTPEQSLVPQVAAMTAYGSAFVLGWLLQRQANLLDALAKRWPVNLGVALAATLLSAFLIRSYAGLAAVADGWLKVSYAASYAIAVWTSAFAIVGICVRYFGREHAARRYVADASYWIYLVHVPVIFALQAAVMRVDAPWPIKFALVLGAALLLLLLSYRYCVRSTFIGALLNGRKQARSRERVVSGIPTSESST